MCLFIRTRRLCMHDKFTIGLQGRCTGYTGDADDERGDETAKCTFYPNPTRQNLPLFWHWAREDLNEFCGKPGCLYASTMAYTTEFSAMEHLYQDCGVQYFLTDPVHLQNEALGSYRDDLSLAFGRPATRSEVTLCPIWSICNLRATPYFTLFRAALSDMDFLQTLEGRMDESRNLLRMVLVNARATLPGLWSQLRDLKTGTRRLIAVRCHARREGMPRYNLERNVDAAVSWVSGLPRTDEQRKRLGWSLYDCCVHVFIGTPMERQLHRIQEAMEDGDEAWDRAVGEDEEAVDDEDGDEDGESEESDEDDEEMEMDEDEEMDDSDEPEDPNDADYEYEDDEDDESLEYEE